MTFINYVEDIYAKLDKNLPGCPGGLLDVYCVLVLTTGVNTTNENVHDAWSVWCNIGNQTHKSLIPFSDLTSEIQELDSAYRDAIIQVARELHIAE